ncbi:hypothetical protein [Streptomyces sp. NPDC056468]|uniref:hypothetical protein n=1 Tax=Streptomyces sp. NPDC056468 TaxID=3345830 RepID=UPI0036CB31CA
MSDSQHRGHGEDFSTLFSDAGWETRITAEEVLEKWRTFGTDCIDGYPWDIEDYLNDITMRSTLQKVEHSFRELEHTQAAILMYEIHAVDASLQTVFERDVFPDIPGGQWWIRRAPTYAARRFCQEFEQIYKVKIRPKSKFDDDVDSMKALLAEGFDSVDVFVKAKQEDWYVAERPGLLFLACRSATSLPRRAMRALWAWASGELPASQLRAAVDN